VAGQAPAEKARENMMKRLSFVGVAAVVASLLSSAGRAEDTVKIGVIMPYSGQFADPSAQSDDGIKLYLKQHGGKLGGMNVQLIRKDVGGINPPVAKRLAQELITRDNVDILTGFQLTPNALAAADVSAEAKKLMVVMNAATAIITTKSPYLVRVSFTIPQLNQTLATWAAQHGLKKAYILVTDYGPGIDAEAAFQKGFTEAGGEIVGSVRMAVQSPDFSAYVQRAKDLNPQGIFIMIPGGAQPGAFGKALAERGLDPQKIEILGTGGNHRRARAGKHGRCRYRRHQRRALRLQSPIEDERRICQNLQRRIPPQS
jgi:branched-chain amino acid transport system substrate-binding protein